MGTVEGHRRVDMAQMARDEIDTGLPPERGRTRGRWQGFLRNLIEGRMEPTDWLNANFKDPLFISEAAAMAKRAEAVRIASASANPLLEGVDRSNDDSDDAKGNSAECPEGALINFGEDDFAVALPEGGVLTAQSKTLPDTRTEVERRFPEFFVEKLQKDGWNARHTPMSVLNPEHPQFVGKKKGAGGEHHT